MNRRFWLVLGLLLLITGVVGVYNLFVGPADRLWGRVGSLPAFFFSGPFVATAGYLIVRSAWRGGPRAEGHGTGSSAVRGGVTLMGVTVVLLGTGAISGNEMVGFLGSLSVYFLGLPGLALVAFGVSRRRSQG